MTAVATDVLCVSGATRHEADEVSGSDANQRMRDSRQLGVLLEKGMPAVAGILGKAVARCDEMHAVAEQAAEIADPLAEREPSPVIVYRCQSPPCRLMFDGRGRVTIGMPAAQTR